MRYRKNQKSQTLDREKIEEEDQRLTNRLREIIHNKERPLDNKRHVWQPYRFWLPVLCTGLIIAGLMIFREQPATIVSINSAPPSRDTVENGEASVLEKSTDQGVAADAEDMAPAAESPEKASLLASKETAPTEIRALSREPAPKSPEVLLNTDRSTEEIATAQSTPAQQNRKSSSIQIADIVSCSSVRKRQYVSPKTVFSLKKSSTPIVWMNVLSDKPPFTLFHVYYVNGSRYCRVPLKIRHRRMRTWSTVTLNSRKHHGKWRVEVITDNGEKLDQIEFTVVP
jgi:hypothetical protein